MTHAPHTQALDEHMNEMVLALHAAVNRAMPHVRDDPELVDQALRDCQEILEVVLEGNVAEWLGGPTRESVR
jgi:hypothetical protein